MQKLNEFLNPELQEQGIAYMRYLKNSIKRNIIFPSISMVNSQALSEYQTKLTRHNFQQNDLCLLFQHLYSKEEMSVSDRNLIRRILLTLFPEALISAGGKKLVSCTNLISLKKGDKFNGENKLYLILKGTVKVNSPFYHKILNKGMYFGHLQLQTHMHGNSFIVTVQSEKAYLISITDEFFYTGITKYFHNIFDEKLLAIPKCITDKIQPIQTYLLCQEMQKKIYTIGNKINKKGQPINQIIFIEQGKINQNIGSQSNRKLKIQNVIGLAQIILGSSCYYQDNFTLEQTKAYLIPLKKFMKIAEKDIVNNLRSQSRISHSMIQYTARRHRTQMTEVQTNKLSTLNPLKKFMKIKKVNLPYTKLKSPKSQNTSTDVSKLSKHKYQASFIFLNTNQIQTPQRNKQGRVNRSFSLAKQQCKSIHMQKYLDNIQIPSLAKFKTSQSVIL